MCMSAEVLVEVHCTHADKKKNSQELLFFPQYGGAEKQERTISAIYTAIYQHVVSKVKGSGSQGDKEKSIHQGNMG